MSEDAKLQVLYSVREDEGVTVIEVTPESPINGFYGCTLRCRDLPGVDHEVAIQERLRWKLEQELGQTIKNIVMVKV